MVTMRAHVIMPAAAAAAIALFPVQSGASAAAGDHSDAELLLDLGQPETAPDWSLRLGLVAGWTLTGVLCSSSPASALLPFPVLAMAGWILFEAGDGATRDLALQANMAVMAVLWVSTASLASQPEEIDTLDPAFHEGVLSQRLTWHSLLSPLMSAPAEFLATWLWTRAHPDREHRFKVAVAPVLHAGQVTGASVALTLIR
jgi:hypothetical protein